MVSSLLAPDCTSDVNPRDRNGETPLHLAVLEGKVENFHKLIADNRTDRHSMDNADLDVLHKASNRNTDQPIMANAILECAGAKTIQGLMAARASGGDHDGWIALHFVAAKGHLIVVAMLLINRADKSAKTRGEEGFDAEHIARNSAASNNLDAADYIRHFRSRHVELEITYPNEDGKGVDSFFQALKWPREQSIPGIGRAAVGASPQLQTIHDLVYKSCESVDEVSQYIQRWFHLPANNVSPNGPNLPTQIPAQKLCSGI